jgi:hypothetical protein
MEPSGLGSSADWDSSSPVSNRSSGVLCTLELWRASYRTNEWETEFFARMPESKRT